MFSWETPWHWWVRRSSNRDGDLVQCEHLGCLGVARCQIGRREGAATSHSSYCYNNHRAVCRCVGRCVWLDATAARMRDSQLSSSDPGSPHRRPPWHWLDPGRRAAAGGRRRGGGGGRACVFPPLHSVSEQRGSSVSGSATSNRLVK